MRQTLFFILILAIQNAFGQFAIVHDMDGFVNVRVSPKISKNVTDTIYNGQIVYCLELKNDWYPIDYEKGEKSWSGYVNKSRLIFLSEFDSMSIQRQTNNKVIFQKDSFKVTLTSVPFILKNNKLEYGKGDQSSFLDKINSKEFWGEDGGIPKTQYGQVYIEWRDKKIDLPKESLEDLFNPNFEHGYTTVNFDKENNTMYIIGQNSDGAGGYAVLWIIENGKYKGRFVTHGF